MQLWFAAIYFSSLAEEGKGAVVAARFHTRIEKKRATSATSFRPGRAGMDSKYEQNREFPCSNGSHQEPRYLREMQPWLYSPLYDRCTLQRDPGFIPSPLSCAGLRPRQTTSNEVAHRRKGKGRYLFPSEAPSIIQLPSHLRLPEKSSRGAFGDPDSLSSRGGAASSSGWVNNASYFSLRTNTRKLYSRHQLTVRNLQVTELQWPNYTHFVNVTSLRVTYTGSVNTGAKMFPVWPSLFEPG